MNARISLLPALRNLFLPRSYDAIVVSYGGAGSTFLLDFLRQHLRTNESLSDRDGIKHISGPLHPILRGRKIRRALYVYEEPALAVASIFRRDYQSAMLVKLNSQHRTASEYRRNIRSNALAIDLESYVACGEDQFHILEHMVNWTAPKEVPYPIMCIKYQSIHDQLPALFGFLNLPEGLLGQFPVRKERSTSLSELSQSSRQGLLNVYGEANERFRQLPPVLVHNP